MEEALPDRGLRDPRPFYRPVLKHLREHDPDAFARALTHFESVLIPALAEGADPIQGWMDYGLLLAEAVGRGRLLEIDDVGRARPGGGATVAGLLMYLPDDPSTPALLLRYPTASSPAQDATVELLVAGRVTASAYN